MASQLSVRKVLPGVSNLAKRCFSVDKETREQIGAYWDPAEQLVGKERKIFFARMAGDDRYEPKIYRKGPSTEAKPNLVPIHASGQNRVIGCQCEGAAGHINYMWMRLGEKKRCECGFWFKAVQGDEDANI